MVFYHVAIYSVKFILALLVHYMNTMFHRWLLRLKNKLLSLSHNLSPTEYTLNGMNLLSHSSPKRLIWHSVWNNSCRTQNGFVYDIRRSTRKAYHENVDFVVKLENKLKNQYFF